METNFNFLLTIPAEIRTSFLVDMPNLADRILSEAVLPTYDTFKVDATGKLRKGFQVNINRISQFVVAIDIDNVAFDKHYPDQYYWQIIKDGRKPQPAFKGTRKGDPFMKSVDNWADAKGFTGNRFWLAKNINTRGIEGKPKVFQEIVRKSEEFIIGYVDEMIGAL